MVGKKFFKPSELKKRFLLSLSTSRLAIPLLIAAIVGICVGFIIVLFIEMIARSEHLFFSSIRGHLVFLGPAAVILIPALGGLVVAFMTSLAPEARGHGVPQVMKAIALKQGYMRPVAVLVKTFASVISIGSGASVGREGPAVYLGAGVGSIFARIFRLSEARIKNLVACGTAAGISAVFNAPITGVMFALEVILRDFGARALSTVVVSSVSASIIVRMYLGESPAFIVPLYSLWSPWEIFLYLGLGVLAAFISLFFIFSLDSLERIAERIRIPIWLKTCLGGFLVGCIGYFFPDVFGMGFSGIEKALHGNIALDLMLALVFMKVFATSLSLSTGSSGGTFAPSLFTGAMLGGAFGMFCQGRFPFPVAPPGAYAIVGMASVFAGSFHSPVTAIMLIFEMTGDYQMILPIMVAAVVAASISQLVSRESIDTVKLVREGLNLASLEEVRVLGAIQVCDAMTKDFELINRRLSVKELIDKMSREQNKIFFVVTNDGKLTGRIRRKDLQDILMEKDVSLIIAEDITTPVKEYCFPDDPLSEAASLMMHHHLTALPVVDPRDPRQVIGVLKSEDVFRAYTQEAIKRDEILSRMEQEGWHARGPVDIRFTIAAHSPVAGKTIKELDIPEGVVLTSIQRRRSTLIPEGHTKLKPKDRVWAVVHPQAESAFREWLKKNRLQRKSLFEIVDRIS